jgi:hypothetical protein
MLHHCEWAYRKCVLFYGREEMLQTAMQAVYLSGHISVERQGSHVANLRLMSPSSKGQSATQLPTTATINKDNKYGVSLCIVGKSGAGK